MRSDETKSFRIILGRCLIVALVVGAALNLINQGPELLAR